jgi:hypothetical protein
MRRAARAEVSNVVTAAREDRKVVLAACAAMEQVARTAIRITRTFEAESIAAWRPVPFIGPCVSVGIAAGTWIAVHLFSVVVFVLVACDIVLSTSTHDRVAAESRTAGSPPERRTKLGFIRF